MKQGKAIRTLPIGGDDIYYLNFYLIKNETGQTLNQWLKGTILKKSFSIQQPNIFTPVHWTLTMPVY